MSQESRHAGASRAIVSRLGMRGYVLFFAGFVVLLGAIQLLLSRRGDPVATEGEGQMYTEQSFRGASKERVMTEGGTSEDQGIDCSLLCPASAAPPAPVRNPKCPEPKCPQLHCPPRPACPACPAPPDKAAEEAGEEKRKEEGQEGEKREEGGEGEGERQVMAVAQPPADGEQGAALWGDDGFHYYPFDDMFFPFNASTTNEAEAGQLNWEAGQEQQEAQAREEAPTWRSLVLFTAGRSGMENVDRLVTLWGSRYFDYVLMHFDDSAGEWNRFEWYKRVVSVSAQRQAKFWYYKRFAAPWAVKGYRYVHFVDSDAGSPEERPFSLQDYENFLAEHRVMIGQPAISDKGRSSDHSICRVHPDMLFRWVSLVENGPLYSVAQQAYGCYWNLLAPDMVSGWGPDTAWCPYLSEVCGYPEDGACAIIDTHYIDHLDKKTASGFKYRGRDYWDYGFEEWAKYKSTVEKVLKSPYQANPTFFKNVKMVPLPQEVVATARG